MVTGLAMAACAQKPVPVAAPPAEPDPFGYRKVSAVCKVGPLTGNPGGPISVAMAVRSDDGLCVVPVQQTGGGAYASFLLTTVPQHGKAFIHNYNGQTLVDYTATTAYAGPDAFTVSLVPVGNGPRTSLSVTETVDNTGVPVPAAAPAVAPAPATTSHTTSHHATTRHSTTKRSGSASH